MNIVGWRTNEFKRTSELTFPEFIRLFPDAKPGYRGDQRVWFTGEGEKPWDGGCWTYFPPDQNTPDDNLIEAIAWELRGGNDLET